MTGLPRSEPPGKGASAPSIFAHRYRVQGELGRGGMATVYLALDSKHERRVALKVFRTDLAAAVGPERFLREIRITASLNHPHILPLLDSGDAGGVLYYVMPYVAGGSLRRLLAGEEGIPLEAALRILREVASALDYAHGRGVVHRDIKPENILFNEGLAVVGDFGIARAVSAAPREHMTRTGVAVGTLGYMSPEQALGTGELDARTDVFSLGCVAYEMLTGGTPASWLVPEDVRLGRLSDVPVEHRTRLDGLPGRVEQVLARALALRPGDRFSSAGEMAESLVQASERTPLFSEEQVRRLLDRAAELQALEPVEDGALTIGAVEQVAAQVGIPPEHVREAARELKGGSRGAAAQDPEGVWLRPPDEKWDRVVFNSSTDGEVSDEAFPLMVEEIQESLGIVGHASILAGTLTWSPATHGEESRRVVVSVRSRDGATRVRVEERFELRGFRRVFVVLGGLTGVLTAALLSTVLGIPESAAPALILPVVALGVVGGVVGTIRFEANSRRGQLEALAGRLVAMAEAAVERKKLGPGA